MVSLIVCCEITFATEKITSEADKDVEFIR